MPKTKSNLKTKSNSNLNSNLKTKPYLRNSNSRKSNSKKSKSSQKYDNIMASGVYVIADPCSVMKKFYCEKIFGKGKNKEGNIERKNGKNGKEQGHVIKQLESKDGSFLRPRIDPFDKLIRHRIRGKDVFVFHTPFGGCVVHDFDSKMKSELESKSELTTELTSEYEPILGDSGFIAITPIELVNSEIREKYQYQLQGKFKSFKIDEGFIANVKEDSEVDLFDNGEARIGQLHFSHYFSHIFS